LSFSVYLLYTAFLLCTKSILLREENIRPIKTLIPGTFKIFCYFCLSDAIPRERGQSAVCAQLVSRTGLPSLRRRGTKTASCRHSQQLFGRTNRNSVCWGIDMRTWVDSRNHVLGGGPGPPWKRQLEGHFPAHCEVEGISSVSQSYSAGGGSDGPDRTM